MIGRLGLAAKSKRHGLGRRASGQVIHPYQQVAMSVRTSIPAKGSRAAMSG